MIYIANFTPSITILWSSPKRLIMFPFPPYWNCCPFILLVVGCRPLGLVIVGCSPLGLLIVIEGGNWVGEFCGIWACIWLIGFWIGGTGMGWWGKVGELIGFWLYPMFIWLGDMLTWFMLPWLFWLAVLLRFLFFLKSLFGSSITPIDYNFAIILLLWAIWPCPYSKLLA